MSSTVNLSDVQGVILHGYGYERVRHYLLKINSKTGVRNVLNELVKDKPHASGLQITSAASESLAKDHLIDESNKPYALNMAFTFDGLRAVGVPEHSLDSFKTAAPAFSRGARRRARQIGDVGKSDPALWDAPYEEYGDIHLLCSLYANKKDTLKQYDYELKALLGIGDSSANISECGRHNGKHLTPRGKREEHFGFRDGIEQPEIAGVGKKTSDSAVATGAFLLGYPSQWDKFEYPLPQPAVLAFNGSFGAFRVLQQHVGSFYDYVETTAAAIGVAPELLKAKMFGRWPDGDPLDRYPDAPGNGGWRDDFSYEDDPTGLKCPVGAHIRRANPRLDSVSGNESGKVASKRRIIRRGVPYGGRDTADEKGLLGLFLCASLEDQFEFLMKEWHNKGGFNEHLPVSSRDPIIGANDGRESRFRVSPEAKDMVAEKLPAFVTTRGALYCFYPSMSGLRYIAAIKDKDKASE